MIKYSIKGELGHPSMKINNGICRSYGDSRKFPWNVSRKWSDEAIHEKLSFSNSNTIIILFENSSCIFKHCSNSPKAHLKIDCVIRLLDNRNCHTVGIRLLSISIGKKKSKVLYFDLLSARLICIFILNRNVLLLCLVVVLLWKEYLFIRQWAAKHTIPFQV